MLHWRSASVSTCETSKTRAWASVTGPQVHFAPLLPVANDTNGAFQVDLERKGTPSEAPDVPGWSRCTWPPAAHFYGWQPAG